MRTYFTAVILNGLTFTDSNPNANAYANAYPFTQGAVKIAYKEGLAIAIFDDKSIKIGVKGAANPLITLVNTSSSAANPFTAQDIAEMLYNRSFTETVPNPETDIMTQELEGPKIFTAYGLRYNAYIDTVGIYFNDLTGAQDDVPLIRFYFS